MSRAAAGVLVLMALLMALAGTLQARLEPERPVSPLAPAQLYVRSAKVLDRLSLSYDALVADVYWIRAIQHFGDERRSSSVVKRFDLLYPLLDLTTSLDPYFNAAYYFGSFFLAEPLPGGAGRPDLGIALLKRAMEYQPNAWRFPQQIGFMYYWYLGDFDEAASWFHRAATRPGAPPWIAALEATTRAHGGDLESSRRIWQQVIETSEDEGMRETARLRLGQVEASAAIEVLEGIASEFARVHGRPPASWDELIRAGRLTGVPVDSTGTPFVLEEAGYVNVSPDSPLYPLPRPPSPREF